MTLPRSPLVALLALAAFSLIASAAAAVFWEAQARPWRTPPRDPAAIEADWARVSPSLPSADGDPFPADLAARFEAAAAEAPTPEAVAALGVWVAEGGRLPAEGCPPKADPLHPGNGVIFAAARNLAATRPREAERLGAQARGRGLIGLAVGAAIAGEIADAGGSLEDPPRPRHLLDALAWEAACADLAAAEIAAGRSGLDGLGSRAERWRTDPEVERLRIRDYFARLLTTLGPVRDDRAAMLAALGAFDGEIPDSLVARALTDHIDGVAADYLTTIARFEEAP